MRYSRSKISTQSKCRHTLSSANAKMFLLTVMVCNLWKISLCQLLPEPANDSYEKAIDFLPPPPNAAAMIQYGNISVNKNTGAPSINIPLYTLKAGKLSTAVSIGYSTTGIKVDEISSRVGMGWSVNLGGVITRTVRGKVDELNTREYPNAPVTENWPTLMYMNRIVSAAAVGGRDGEPDLYNFSFEGNSGSFVTDGLNHPFLINKNGIKIVYPVNGDNWNFKLITTDGTSYFFGGEGKVEKTKRLQSCGKSYDTYIPTAYYLSRIQALNGESIVFNYLPIEYTYSSGISQVMTEDWGGTPAPGCQTRNTSCANICKVQGYYLHKLFLRMSLLISNIRTGKIVMTN